LKDLPYAQDNIFNLLCEIDSLWYDNHNNVWIYFIGPKFESLVLFK